MTKAHQAEISKDPKLLAELAKDENKHVRYYVADNKDTPPDILAELAKDKSWLVRYFVARHKSTAPISLVQLANDKSEVVRIGALKNANCPRLVKLLRDED